MVSDHYKKILQCSDTAFDKLLADDDRHAKFTTAHNHASDLDLLEALITNRPEAQMYSLARIEYQHALYSAAFAHYRQAHVSLRLFFELSLSCILFSAHEIDAKLWIKNRKDVNWSNIISKDNGIFSKHFVGAFFEELKDECDEYHALACSLYRECSQFVHGNRQSFDGIDGRIEYTKEALESWTDRADTAQLVIKFAFLSRHINGADKKTKDKVECLALESFGTIPAIQSLFNEA